MKRHYVFPTALVTVLSLALLAPSSNVSAQDNDAYSEAQQASDEGQNAVPSDSEEQAEDYSNDTFDTQSESSPPEYTNDDSEDVGSTDDSILDDTTDDSGDTDSAEDNSD